ncbi:MAG: PAS domain-containing sensor histidine kinase [Candidatus Gracilibacteria bacterium]|nr:PAS domain-containing sensor histidine kinase [Candidatus Gracilibacteria bacterium]
MSHFQESLDQYRQALEQIEDILFVVNDKGVIKYVNRALRNFLGQTDQYFTGLTIDKCELFDHKLARKADIIKMLFSERSFLSTGTNGAGEKRYLEWKNKVFDANKKKKVIAVVRDITDSVLLRKKIEDYNENLLEMVEKRTMEIELQKNSAIELASAKAIFMSKMTHELRTPLTAMTGYCELIEDLLSAQQSEAKKYLAIIERNSRSLLEIIDDVIDMVRLEQEWYQIKNSRFDIRALIEEIKETYSIFAREKGLQINLVVSEKVQKTLLADSQAVRRVITNLIGNALKYTHSGNILIRVTMRYFPKMKRHKLYIYVKDTGMGIPEDQQKLIFKPFYQYNENQPSHQRSSGLGLAISKHLAKLMGGDLKLVSSTVGEGSSFVFSIPVKHKRI